MKRLLCSIIFVLLSFFSIFAEDIKLPRLAVVEFSINDTNNQKLVNDAIAVRNQVQSNIIKSGKYDVIARQEIDKLLENQKIQVSAISASENIKKLKLLNISYMVTGSVDALDNDYVVSISVLDVANGKFTYSDEEFIGSSSSEIYKGIGSLISRFYKGINSEGAQIVAKSQTLRTNNTNDTVIRITTGFASKVVYEYDGHWEDYHYVYQHEDHYLWENEPYEMPITEPGEYRFTISVAGYRNSLIKIVRIKKRGIYDVYAFMPPQNIKTKLIGMTSIDLIWDSDEKEYLDSYIDGLNRRVKYIIDYYPENMENELKTYETSKNEISLNNLRKDTTYIIIIKTIEQGRYDSNSDYEIAAESPVYAFKVHTQSE